MSDQKSLLIQMAPWNVEYDFSRMLAQGMDKGKSGQLDDTEIAGSVARDYLVSLGHDVHVSFGVPPHNEKLAPMTPDIFLGVGAGDPFNIPHHEAGGERRKMGVETSYPIAWIGCTNLTSTPWSAFYRAFVRGREGDVELLGRMSYEATASYEDRLGRDTLIRECVDVVLDWLWTKWPPLVVAAEQDIPSPYDGVDVFICYNSNDLEHVRPIADRLKAAGLTVFMDIVSIQPGTENQMVLNDAIKSAKSVAVFVGGSGIGPWQSIELQEAISSSTRIPRPIMPVLLPNCAEKVGLPFALGTRTWVDLRNNDDGFNDLHWGITGNRRE